MQSRAIRFIVALALAVLAIACDPIYWRIEREPITENKKLEDKITVFDVALEGAGGPYYAAAGTIWKGDAALLPDNFWWDPDTVPPGLVVVAPPADGAMCNALVYYDSTLWGGFIDGSGSLGLYRSSTAPLSFAGQSAETDAAVDGQQVIRLKVVNGYLVIITADGSLDYSIHSFDGLGDAYDPVDLSLTGHTAATLINDVAFFDGNYYATSGAKLYAGAGPLVDVTDNLPALDAGDELRDLFVNAGTLYLTSRLSTLYYTTDGATWEHRHVVDGKGVAIPDVPLTALCGPVDGTIVVGTDGYGYCLFDGSSLVRLDKALYESNPIYDASIHRFLLDPGARLFAGTFGGGLLRAEAPSSTMTWVQE
jgi:hypothetical protein